MAALSIHDPKKVVDVVDVTFDFITDMEVGETISTAVTTVSVHTGLDNAPSALLYQVVTIVNFICTQKIQKGLPGVVYDILMTVVTSTGRTVEQVTRIAILPDANPAVPIYIPLYFSTPPYPINQTEYLQSFSISSITGRLQLQPQWMDSIRGSTFDMLFDLYGGSQTYSNPFESVQGSLASAEFDLYGNSVTYSTGHDDAISGDTSNIVFDLYGNEVSYANPFESIMGATSAITFGIT